MTAKLLMSAWVRKAALPIVAALMLPVLTCWPWGGPSGPGSLPGNLAVIEAGRAYRSAQPSAEGLAVLVERYGIRTVVNLRGANPGQPWYDAEVAACDQMGLTLANYAMNSKSLPSPELLGAILDTLQSAEPPILIHCAGGADRTGAVAAIYRMLVLGHDKTDALAELSPERWHFRANAPCMDTLAELYEPGAEWLDEYAATFDELTCKPQAASLRSH